MIEVLAPFIFLVIVILFVVVLFTFVPVGLWVSALAAGVKVGLFNLIGMRLRRIVPNRIVLPLIKAEKAEIDVQIGKLEAHYLAGGNVDRVVDALIMAQRAGINLNFSKAAAIDL